jgi:hypothetical protein
MNEACTIDMIELKSSLLVEGVRATEEALTGVGKDYKEQNHGLFGWDMEDHAGADLPDDFLLPDGTVVPFVWSANPGSRLAGYRAPSGKWYADVIREAAGLVLE